MIGDMNDPGWTGYGQHLLIPLPSAHPKVVLTKSELEALQEAIRRRFQDSADAPDPDALETAEAKVKAALLAIAEAAE